jgi:tetratricopeptide (TPR) repeat protein
MIINKSAFISYRRRNYYIALAVYQDLTANGFDVFLDTRSISSGSFERIILNQIGARAHFLLILAPTTLDEVLDPNDWLRREIERALELKRNVVPLFFDGFNFKTVTQTIPPTVVPVCSYQGLSVPPEYFQEAMVRLRSEFLVNRPKLVLHPPSSRAVVEANRNNQRLRAEPAVTETDLVGDVHIEHGFGYFKKGAYESAVREFTQALEQNPKAREAYLNRGAARVLMADYDAAIVDLNSAIALGTDDPIAYWNRGVAFFETNQLDQATHDLTQVLRLDPKFPGASSERSRALMLKGDYEAACQDADRAVELAPTSCEPYLIRALPRLAKGDLQSGIDDLEFALQLNPHFQDAKDLLRDARRRLATEHATSAGERTMVLAREDKTARALPPVH